MFRALNLALLFCFISSLPQNLHDAVDSRKPCPCSYHRDHKQRRVVGGHDAGHGKFPYASCLVDDIFSRDLSHGVSEFCGATLITDLHVVTAAHCVKSYTADDILVDVGDYALGDDIEGQFRHVRSITRHKSYIPGKFYYDIALIEFKRPVRWTHGVKAAWLPPPTLDLKPGTTVSVYGWGRLDYTGNRSPDHLQSVELPVIESSECQEKFQTEIRPNMLCAGGQVGRDACLGDSGSGLVVRLNNEYVLCGLVSFGRRCAMPGVAGVYTRVSSYIDWIYENTKSASCRPCIYNENNVISNNISHSISSVNSLSFSKN